MVFIIKPKKAFPISINEPWMFPFHDGARHAAREVEPEGHHEHDEDEDGEQRPLAQRVEPGEVPAAGVGVEVAIDAESRLARSQRVVHRSCHHAV